MTALAQKVRLRRETLHLSYNDLSSRLRWRGLDVSRTTLSKWERGHIELNFNPAQIALLADALKCAPDDLLSAHPRTEDAA